MSAVNLISNQTCLKFIQLFQATNETGYVAVKNGDGCTSDVGYRASEAQMSLNVEVCAE
jgi:Astacin (Peptidase family M12A)